MDDQYKYKDSKHPRLERKSLNTKLFLRKDHFDRLSRTKNGVLRDLTIATANLHSTYNPNEILDIFTDSDEEKKHQYSNISMANKIAHTGAMVIPYPNYGLENIGERNWRRMRTDLSESKYLSPLGQYSPPYRVLGLDHPKYIELFKKQIIDEAFKELKLEPTPANLQTVYKTLETTNYDKLNNSYQNPEVPIIVVEGEFKALAIFDALLDAHKECIKHVLTSKDKDFAQLELAGNNMLPPLVSCVGIGGVWNMTRKDLSPDAPTTYKVRPEWESSIKLDNRKVLICFDSDSKWITQVGHAATSLAQACENFGSEVSYIIIPSPKGHKYGADDYIQAFGYRPFLDLIPKAERIASGLAFNAIANATRSGTSAIDFLIEEAKNPTLEPTEKQSISKKEKFKNSKNKLGFSLDL